MRFDFGFSLLADHQGKVKRGQRRVVTVMKSLLFFNSLVFILGMLQFYVSVVFSFCL